MTLTAGTRVGKYEIKQLLGAGGMGEVYLAEDTRLGRRVALKLLPAEFGQDAERLGRFEQEARAASALNHPNIITLHEIGEAEVGYFIVLEFVQGRALRELIGRDFPIDSLLEIGAQVAKALSLAHDLGIIHRDIKPDNVMVRDDGIVKVLDFGLARLSAPGTPDPEAETAVHTQHGHIIGTVSYMSPEQARGEAVTCATDIFSLGTMLYEMATGSKPFKGDSHFGTLEAIVYADPLPPARLNAAVPRTLEALIMRLLAKDARLRPSAQEVEAALREARGSENETTQRRESLPATPRPAPVAAPRRVVVGHEWERERLRAAFAGAEAGRGLMVCVAGEAGLGKSTLVEDFLDELTQRHSCHVARGRNSERLAGTEAYLPFLEALESLLRETANLPLAHALKTLAPSWHAQVETVSGSAAEVSLNQPVSSTQERMKRELAAFLQEASRRRPLVLFFDDLHWADASTVDLIAYVATKLAEMRLLFVVTYRPAEMLLRKHPFVPVKLEMQAHGLCQELELELLKREDVASYLALEFTGHRFADEFVELIYARTEGNPLFMADLLRYLRDRGVIFEKDGAWAVAGSIPDLERELPESVRSMIERKVGQLDEEQRRLLSAASVQGYEFDSAVLARALSLDAGDVEERLEELERKFAFVKLLREEEFPDRTLTSRYRFVHLLYQNALYAALRPTRRAGLSGTIAEALLGFYGKRTEEVAAQLASLFEAARDFSRATDFYLLAARGAARVCAYREAVVLARHGLATLRALPESDERDRRELRLQIIQGVSLMTTQGYASPEIEETYERARGLCQRLGESVKLFPVLAVLGGFCSVRAEHEAAYEMARQLLPLAEQGPDATQLAEAHWALGATETDLGKFESALDNFRKGIAYCKSQTRGSGLLNSPHDPGVRCLAYGARALWFLGYAEQSQDMLDEALTLAEKIANPHTLNFALMIATYVYQYGRETEKTLTWADKALALSREHGFAYLKALMKIARGWALARLGCGAEGGESLRRGLAAYKATGAGVGVPHFYALLAETQMWQGSARDGLATLEQALALVHKTKEAYYEAEVHRVRGEVLLKRDVKTSEATADAQAEAEDCFREAVSIARRQQAKFFEVRAATSLAGLWQRQGRATEARAMLAESYGWFTEGFDAPDLKEAKALLDSLV